MIDWTMLWQITALTGLAGILCGCALLKRFLKQRI